MKLNENVEITIPLRTLVSVAASLLIASWSWYVFRTQTRIAELEHKVQLADQRFEQYLTQPSRAQSDLDLLKKDLEYLRKDLDQQDQKVRGTASNLK